MADKEEEGEEGGEEKEGESGVGSSAKKRSRRRRRRRPDRGNAAATPTLSLSFDDETTPSKQATTTLTVSAVKDLSSASHPLSANAAPVHLLEIKARGPLDILSAAISSDGRYVAMSNIEMLWIYRVIYCGQGSKVECVARESLPSYSVKFVPGSDAGGRVVMATIDDGVVMATLGEVEDDTTSPCLTSWQLVARGNHPVVTMEICSRGQYVALQDSRERIAVYRLPGEAQHEEAVLVAKLPHLDEQPVVFTFTLSPPHTSTPSQRPHTSTPSRPHASTPSQHRHASTPSHLTPSLVLFSGRDSALFLFDLQRRSLSAVGELGELLGSKVARSLANPSGIVPLTAAAAAAAGGGRGQDHTLAVFDSTTVVFVRFSSSVAGEISTPAERRPGRKWGRCRDDSGGGGCGLRACVVRYNLLHGLLALGDGGEGQGEGRRGEVVVVDQTQTDFAASLPPALHRKRYDT